MTEQPVITTADDDRIAWLRLRSVALPLASPISDAKVLTGRQKPMTEIAILIAEVETRDGQRGLGFSYSKRAGGPGQFAHALEVAPNLLGENPSDIARLWDKLCWAGASVGRSGLATQAIGAFDVALWDLKARRAGLSLARLLGAQRDSVRCYNTSGGFLHTPLEQLLKNTEISRDKGIGGIKLKVGQPDWAHGNMRELTLGLEVVLPDGQIWNGLRGLRKDNTGYDLKQLFIGAEGTLGIITAAVLKLYPAIRRRATAWAALVDAESAVALLGTLRGYCGERLSGFELMSRQSLDFVLRHQPGSVDPFDTAYPCYLLVELSDPAAAAALDETLQVALGEGVELGLLQDAVIASSQAQAAALWRLREGISEAQNHEGPSLKHDISVPISSIPAFIAGTGARLQEALPGVRIVCYGHVGDGNLHYNLSKPPGMEDAAFLAQSPQLTGQVFDATLALNGSISAEHGLGQAKREAARHYKNPLEQALMRALKDTLDPKGLMNPGKVL